MIGVVLRRKAGEGKAAGLVAAAHYEDKPVARGWLNLRGEIVGEMRTLGVNPGSADVGSARGERRGET